MEQVAVMQNIFYGKKISKVFDLKGSLRGRFARHLQGYKDSEAESDRKTSQFGSDSELSGDEADSKASGDDGEDDTDDRESQSESHVLLDGDFLEFTNGRPLPLSDRAKAVFHMSVLNVSLCEPL
jgi:1-phosphatidylinositol-3-phosphate 5-kinase